MEAFPDPIDSVNALRQSLESSSLIGSINVEKGGDYNFDAEEQIPFECKKVLGHGGSAVVEKVEHRRTKEIFARKVIEFPHGKGKRRQKAEERYYNEIAIIRTLDPHVHVVELFATYTMPYSGALLLRPAADQGDLQHYLDYYADALDDTTTPPAVVSEMTEVLEKAFGCLSSALAYMHNLGIRHKDIKPGNILIHRGIVIYTDFGAAKDTKKDGQCTTEGRPESMTRRYCAPEVLEYEKRNSAADIFSLGCVFVEMLLRLSRVMEHEDLEAGGYSGIMDALHTSLTTAEIPSNVACLLEIVILMTLRDPSQRPISEVVAANICSRERLSCPRCHVATPHIKPQQLHPQSAQPEWNYQFQRYLYLQFDNQYQRWYWNHHDGQNWVFFDWVPLNPAPAVVQQLLPQVHAAETYSAPSHQRMDSVASGGPAGIRQGKQIFGSFDGQPNSHCEQLDSAFYVRDAGFFIVGRVFSILFSEAAGTNASIALRSINNITDYNSSISMVKYRELVHTQVRRFIVVMRKNAFYYAVPIFTYQGQGTKKPGLDPHEHAIAFSYGYAARLLPDEPPLDKHPICIVMNNGERALPSASRIYFGIQHPIQYNVKVKDLGFVHPDCLATFLEYWKMENISDTRQSNEVTNEAAQDEGS